MPDWKTNESPAVVDAQELPPSFLGFVTSDQEPENPDVELQSAPWSLMYASSKSFAQNGSASAEPTNAPGASKESIVYGPI